jgi:lysophospholipase L1-like esterase
MRDRLSPRLLNLILLMFGTAVGLLLSEALVRRFVPQERALSTLLRGLYIPHPRIGYVLKPGFHRHVETSKFDVELDISALGLRERPVPPKQTHVRRILALGDSFTFGIHAGPPESTYVKKLELAVQRSTSRQIEIINAGVEGYGTEQAFLLLQELAPKLQPDAVLCSFYLGNDFTDNSGRTRMSVVNGYLMLEASAEPYREYARPLHRRIRLALHTHSQLYLLLKRVFIKQATLDNAVAGVNQAPRQIPSYLAYDAGFADSMRRQSSEVMLEATVKTRATLHEMASWCEERDIALLMFAIPGRQQVDAGDRMQWLEHFGLEEEYFDFRLPNAKLRQLAEEARLPLVDLTEVFAARTAAGEELHVHNDNHWNARGHDLAARSLLEPTLHYLLEPAALIGAR